MPFLVWLISVGLFAFFFTAGLALGEGWMQTVNFFLCVVLAFPIIGVGIHLITQGWDGFK